MADQPYDPSVERDALLKKWNPPPEDHRMARVLGTPVPDGDTRATNHEPMSVVNQHILAAQGAPDYSDDADGDEEMPEDYDEWTNEQLRDEIKRRNADRPEDERMNVSGRHAELVERLEADDEEDDEDSEE